MITRLAHINLQTTDINCCIEFYHHGLGLPIAMDFSKDGKLAGAIFKVAERNFIEVFENNPRCGITHFALEVDDIDEFIESVTAKGITCSPKKMGGGGTWATWLSDPDGNAFEVQQYTERSMQLNGGTCEITWKF